MTTAKLSANAAEYFATYFLPQGKLVTALALKKGEYFARSPGVCLWWRIIPAFPDERCGCKPRAASGFRHGTSALEARILRHGAVQAGELIIRLTAHESRPATIP